MQTMELTFNKELARVSTNYNVEDGGFHYSLNAERYWGSAFMDHRSFCFAVWHDDGHLTYPEEHIRCTSHVI